MSAPPLARAVLCRNCSSELTARGVGRDACYEDAEGRTCCPDAEDPTWQGHEPYRRAAHLT